ncbi:hypothetical protein P5F43_14520 [Clostridium perfringens]|uniref:hypothetical protein n=1 Tax=Clostridium perfringens TaxID=1502 RepID=UPI00232EA917|nr:hypothetical protein [Clostridium perfringens]MDB2060217.1 hypothetical protein [Clostridium perfringens]MDB2062079.1 hypothetical protein [Clostridium perfringens]MDB2064925.1 hypothetical protein [Clostridium perfringens]MDK0628869.1 hypothetical protein [Clostridium perfringens]MDK0762133.1 hypothetical protein [Clostridium perfringens]
MNYIVSLVGLSPVPNYISILNYISKEEDNKIFLVYTSENSKAASSLKIAKTLERVIKEQHEKVDIVFIESNKSNFLKINESVNKIVEEIKKEDNKESKLILDITGSTKANSAIFNNELKEAFLDEEEFLITISYLDNFSKQIQEFDLKRNKEKRVYNIDEIIERTKLSPKNILSLYNYDKYKSVFSLDDIKVYLYGFNLLFYKVTYKEKIKDKKEEIFELFNVAEKLGGRFTTIVYEAKSFYDDSLKDKSLEEKDYMQHFLQKFANEANSSYSNRLVLKSKKDNSYLRIKNNKYTDDCGDINLIIGGES